MYENVIECDTAIQSALWSYLSKKELSPTDKMRFEAGLDAVAVVINDEIVLIISLPPVSNYNIYETEHTHKYLKRIAKTA